MDVENRFFPSAYILNKYDMFLTSGKNIIETFFFPTSGLWKMFTMFSSI